MLLAVLVLTGIFWVPFVLSVILLVVSFTGVALLFDVVFVAALPLGVYDVVVNLIGGVPFSTALFEFGGALAIAGVGLLLAPLAVRVVELAGRALRRGFARMVGLVRRTTFVKQAPWYGASMMLRTFDRICVVAGGLLIVGGSLLATVIIGAHGWEFANLPGIENLQGLVRIGCAGDGPCSILRIGFDTEGVHGLDVKFGG